MAERSEMLGEEPVGTLVVESEYGRSPNQVARVTTHRLIFIKRKELSRVPFEVIDFPIDQCTGISYRRKWAWVQMILGALLALIVIAFFVGEIPAGTTVPVGSLLAALGIGVSLARGPKRHHLRFRVVDRDLHWRSKAGEYKFVAANVDRVLAFARHRGILIDP